MTWLHSVGAPKEELHLKRFGQYGGFSRGIVRVVESRDGQMKDALRAYTGRMLLDANLSDHCASWGSSRLGTY
jgi:hypothetical protein